MRKWLVVVVLWLIPSTLGAQTHPCDVTPPQNPAVFNPYRVQFCWDGMDTDGFPLSPAWIQVRVEIDHVGMALVPLPEPISEASATGERLYEVSGLVSLKGAHSIVVVLVAPEGEGVSVPFAYTVKGKAPKGGRVQDVVGKP